MTRIIGLTGTHRSGKDTVANYLKEKYNFKTLTFSDFLKKRLKKKGKEITKMNLSEEGDQLRKEKGRGALAEEIYEEIKKNNWEKIALSGFMSPEEVEYIKRKTDDFNLVKVTAKSEERFKRRSESEPDNLEEFLQRDKKDEKKGVKEVMETADYEVKNNSSKQDLYEKIDQLMKNIK
ncbi:MAG: AAA family ATPase [archaeon]